MPKGSRQAVPSDKYLFRSPLDRGLENRNLERINSLHELDKVWDRCVWRRGGEDQAEKGLSLGQWAPSELTRAASLSREKSYFLV